MGILSDRLRFSEKIELAAERKPFPVGIGDGGGASDGEVKRLLVRMIAIRDGEGFDGRLTNRRGYVVRQF